MKLYIDGLLIDSLLDSQPLIWPYQGEHIVLGAKYGDPIIDNSNGSQVVLFERGNK